jgi:mannose-6-phosphate isomerase-like protein (cupin superfamily)
VPTRRSSGHTLAPVPFIDASEMLSGAPLPGWSGRFFHSENMTFAHWDIAADAADLHEHHHVQEEVWNVVEGEVVLVVDGEERRLVQGAAAVVPPNTPHKVKVVGACRVVIADYPVRDQLPGVRS